MLSRFRVLDLTSGGASLAGQILADLGADVILVEPPGGVVERHNGPWLDKPDPDASIGFWAGHRNKRSIELNPTTESGCSDLLKLAGNSDVLIESGPTGWLADSGVLLDELCTNNPGLVAVSISPFGRSGPKADWHSTDLTITAASGVMIMTGDEDRAPLACGAAPQAWLNAGADAAVGALLALTERERSGKGQRVDISAQASMMMTAQSYLLSHAWGDNPVERMAGGARNGPLRLRFVYPCRDGFVNFTFLFGPAIGPFTARMFQWLFEEGFVDAATRDKDWVAYAELLGTGREPLSELARCSGAIERFTLSHTKAELFEGALQRRVLIVPLSDTADLAASRQLAARNYWKELRHESPDTTVRYPGPFAKFSETPIEYRSAPPNLGAHQRAVLEEVRTEQPRVTPSTPMQTAPCLEGLRVLDLTWVYAGPAITRMLADHGATVITIDSTTRIDALRLSNPFKNGETGVENSGNFHNANLGKLGLGLDLSIAEGKQLGRRLADWADVVVENFTPKTMRAWGLDYATLQQTNPELVMLSTCLSGQSGPEADLAGFGTMGAAIAGFGFLTGWPDRAPCAPFGAYTDYVSPRFAVCAILAALDHRRRTGRGQHIDCSQIEAGLHMITEAVLEYQINGKIRTAQGNANPHYAPSGVYPVKGEDNWIAIAAPDPSSWTALCGLADTDWLQDARFDTQAHRMANRAILDEAIALWTGNLDGAELEDALQEAGVPAHRVSRSADVLKDPQLHAIQHFLELEHPTLGGIVLENSRIRPSRTPARCEAPGPMIGQHNEKILRDLLGLSDDEITELAISGALQ